MGCPRETLNFDEGQDVELDYRGSPVFSVPQGFRVSTDSRHEDFLPLGRPYTYEKVEYCLYRVPHAIAASRYGAYSGGSRDSGAMTLTISHAMNRDRISVRSKGAVLGSLHDKGELQQAVRNWMSFFDYCVQHASAHIKSSSVVSWTELLKYIREYARNPNVQKRSLIVSIAETMPQHVQELVNSARRVLIHERRLLPATKASEMDSGCLHWYFRQPGVTAMQKASLNRQRLQAISRRETFNTLENRVLRDFLLRCLRECRQYVTVIYAGQANTGCAKDVNRFGGMCSELLKRPVWEDVGELESSVRPNYVLQSDTRYRRIWNLYQKLLRKQDEEDWMWAWQGRTWADVGTLLLGVSLMTMAEKADGRVRVEPLAQAGCVFRREQVQGSRVVPGSEPGPFLLSCGANKAVLEVVHEGQADDHDTVRSLRGTGGTLFFVLKPLGRKNMIRVIIIWPVHTLSSAVKQNFQDILQSAEHGLKVQEQLINMRYHVANFTGLVLVDAALLGEPDFEAGEKTHLARLAADPSLWPKNIDVLTMLLDELFMQLLES